jgi:hypothetical protein
MRDLSENIRRAGWLDILGRDDTLAAACVGLNRDWDGGRDFPASNPLAVLAARLLTDINAAPADNASDAPEGLHALMQNDWPRGTVLTRAHLEAARDNQPWPGE